MEPETVKLDLPKQDRLFIESFQPNLKKFYDFHGVQLLGSQFPVALIPTLYQKLTEGIYDAGSCLEIMDNEDEQQYEVHATKQLDKFSSVYIIDHALTFRFPDLSKLLDENSTLIPRLSSMLKYHQQMKDLPSTQKQDKSIEGVGNFAEIQFDSMDLTELSHLQFPQNTITLSLISNNLCHEEELIKKISYLNLKVLWVNNNPIEDSEVLESYILQQTKIEVYNSKFTRNCTEWGIKFVQSRNVKFAFTEANANVHVLDLSGRDVYQVGGDVWEKFLGLKRLTLKEHSITNEAQEKAMLNLLESTKLNWLHVDYDMEIQLYDLANQQKISQGVLQRLLVNGHSLLLKEPTEAEYEIEQIKESIWKVAGCYRLANSEKLDDSSIWYVNDEVGSAVTHHDDPNVKIVPFLFSQDNQMGQNMVAYSLLWPVKPIKEGELVSRDYLHGLGEKKQRSSRLAIWYNLPDEYYKKIYNQHSNQLLKVTNQGLTKVNNFYLQNTKDQKEYIEKLKAKNELYPEEQRIVTDNDTITDNLKHPQLKLVNDIQDATVIWMVSGFDKEKFIQFGDKYYTNQFPYEGCVVMKHNLANTIQSVLGSTSYLMKTFDLEKELRQFLGEFYERQSKGEDNLWILKPPNMARSIDMIITDNLSLIVKCMETGPKIAQKYISQPVMRRGLKVDLRYVLLVKSIRPLTMYLYKHFFIRSSNNKYTLDSRSLATYETQFTVMNYVPGQCQKILDEDFIEQFEKDYAPHKWSQIHEKIKKSIRNTFIAAAIKYPEMHADKSRAMYGLDIMIQYPSMEPKLLEITFSPDCIRACQFYPPFFNEVMETLYLNTPTENMERII